MTTDVFLSVGRTSTDQQEAFVREVERLLFENDLRPRNVGREEYSSVQPLKAVQEVMDQCQGAVVIAFERLFVQDGSWRRGSSHQESVANAFLPTVWNQIEAALAYSKGLPLLVIVERGILAEGLLEPGYDWFVQRVDLEPSALRTPESVGRLADWKRRVAAFEAARPKATEGTPQLDPASMTIGQIVGALRPAQFRALLAAAIGILSSAFLLGRQLA
jgi:hypothetical protein